MQYYVLLHYSNTVVEWQSRSIVSPWLNERWLRESNLVAYYCTVLTVPYALSVKKPQNHTFVLQAYSHTYSSHSIYMYVYIYILSLMAFLLTISDLGDNFFSRRDFHSRSGPSWLKTYYVQYSIVRCTVREKKQGGQTQPNCRSTHFFQQQILSWRVVCAKDSPSKRNTRFLNTCKHHSTERDQSSV
jgi:hypothetical protein